MVASKRKMVNQVIVRSSRKVSTGARPTLLIIPWNFQFRECLSLSNSRSPTTHLLDLFLLMNGQAGKFSPQQSPSGLAFHRITSVLFSAPTSTATSLSKNREIFSLFTRSIIHLPEKSRESCRICRRLIVSLLPIGCPCLVPCTHNPSLLN